MLKAKGKFDLVRIRKGEQIPAENPTLAVIVAANRMGRHEVPFLREFQKGRAIYEV
jgi:hypothetical protein